MIPLIVQIANSVANGHTSFDTASNHFIAYLLLQDALAKLGQENGTLAKDRTIRQSWPIADNRTAIRDGAVRPLPGHGPMAWRIEKITRFGLRDVGSADGRPVQELVQTVCGHRLRRANCAG